MKTEVIRPGFTKHHLNPTGKKGWSFRPVLHHFTSPDPEDAHYHCHPFDIDVHVTKGPYLEEICTPIDGTSWRVERVFREHGARFIIGAETIHRLIELPEGESWTFCQYGPRRRRERSWRLEGGRVQYRLFGKSEWRDWQP